MNAAAAFAAVVLPAARSAWPATPLLFVFGVPNELNAPSDPWMSRRSWIDVAAGALGAAGDQGLDGQRRSCPGPRRPAPGHEPSHWKSPFEHCRPTR